MPLLCVRKQRFDEILVCYTKIGRTDFCIDIALDTFDSLDGSSIRFEKMNSNEVRTVLSTNEGIICQNDHCVHKYTKSRIGYCGKY